MDSKAGGWSELESMTVDYFCLRRRSWQCDVGENSKQKINPHLAVGSGRFGRALPWAIVSSPVGPDFGAVAE